MNDSTVARCPRNSLTKISASTGSRRGAAAVSASVWPATSPDASASARRQIAATSTFGAIPSSRWSSNIGNALLRLGDAEARGWSAAQLRDSRNRSVLRELLAAYRTESSAANRIEQMTAIYHVSAYLLLHGDQEDQRASLSTIEEIWKIDPILVRRLRPALRTFQSMNPPRKLRLKAEQLAEPTPRTSRTRPDQQG